MTRIGLILMVVFALAMAWPVLAQEKEQKVCPVLQGNIDKNVYVDYKGQRVYFCCKGCDAEFNKDPEKYLKKMESQGVTLEKSPAPAAKGSK